jgi:lactoylglutathione lyase
MDAGKLFDVCVPALWILSFGFRVNLRDCHGPVSRYPERMSKATKLLHTRYRVNDLERTVKFYKDVLGLEEIRRHKSPRGSELVFLKAPESEELIEITYFPGSGPVQVQADLTHLAFEVDSLDDFAKHLAAHGLKFSDGPTASSSGSVFAFIDAPEGYEIELIQKAKCGAGY